MEIEEQNGSQEQGQEQTPAFTFHESPITKDDIILPPSEVVELKDETPDEPAPATDENSSGGDGGAKPETEEGADPPATEEDQAVELDEKLAFDYLKEKRGLDFESFDDFLKSKEPKKVDPEFEKFQEYKAKTGRGYNDFLQTQKDWSQESNEAVVKAVLKMDNPDLSNEELDFLYKKDYVYSEELDDDDDIKSKQINLKVDAKKARDILEKQKQDYLVERGSDDDNVPEVYKEAKELVEQLYDEQQENERISTELRNDFVAKTQSVLNEKFDGFKFTIDGQDFKLKPENIKDTRESQLDIANFQKKFFGQDNKLSDGEGYHTALYFAMNPQKVAEHFYNLGKTAHAEKMEKESKNIDVNGEKHVPEPAISQFTFKKV